MGVRSHSSATHTWSEPVAAKATDLRCSHSIRPDDEDEVDEDEQILRQLFMVVVEERKR
jgi:hypothetical protein